MTGRGCEEGRRAMFCYLQGSYLRRHVRLTDVHGASTEPEPERLI
jgi:hypothetical protein